MIVRGLAFAAGVLLFYLPPAAAPLAVVIFATSAIALAGWRWPVLRPVAWAAVGFLYAQLWACDLLCRPFPEEATGRDLTVTGTIVSLPADTGFAQRFELRVAGAQADGEPLALTGRVRLSWYREPPVLHVGERWRLRVRLKPPHGFANPGGFDYERWLFERGIKATGYVREDAENRRLAASGAGFALARARERLRDHLAARLSDPVAGALIQALVLGERDGLEPPQWEVLTRTGTNHLVAISGLHVGLVSGFAFFVGRWLWSRSARLCLLVAAPRAAAVLGALGALGYSLLAGLAVPTQRALIMLAVVLGALFWGRALRPFAALTLALVGVLLVDPRAVLSFGFWLSFGAVGVLLFALGQRLATVGLWARWGRAQWAVALGLAPLLLLFFGRASLIAPAVNLLAVPLLGLLLPVILTSVLLSLVPGWDLPLALSGHGVGWLYAQLETLAAIPWATVTMAARPAWVWIAAGVGVLLWLAPRGLPGRALAGLWLLPLVLLKPPSPPPGAAWATVLDVGQGQAVVVRTHAHTLVYDTGPGFPSGFNAGAAAVVPYLRAVGVPLVDTLIISHADGDHAGGLPGLLGAVPLVRILSGEPGELERVKADPCRAGQHWEWDGVRFAMLHPERAGYQGNDSSCVLRVAAGRDSLLVPGDIGRAVERDLVARYGAALESDVLIASHHGSSSSSSAAFLAAVAPRLVVYSAGFANRYGFPAATVRARVAAVGAEELATSHTGAIELHLGSGAGGSGAGPAVVSLRRRDAARPWTHRPLRQTR
jgi:competence protein ComEC